VAVAVAVTYVSAKRGQTSANETNSSFSITRVHGQLAGNQAKATKKSERKEIRHDIPRQQNLHKDYRLVWGIPMGNDKNQAIEAKANGQPPDSQEGHYLYLEPDGHLQWPCEHDREHQDGNIGYDADDRICDNHCKPIQTLIAGLAQTSPVC
jgi:hypothetical protein